MNGWYIVGVLLIGILIWRLVLPGIKLAGTAPAATNPGASASSSTATADAKKWAAENGWSIMLVIVGIAAIYWGYNNSNLRPADVGNLSGNHWLPLFIFWVVAGTLVAINADEKKATTLQWVLAGTMLMFLVVLPIVGAFTASPATTAGRAMRSESAAQDQRGDDCTYTRPCKLVVKPDGSTEKVAVQGKVVCFDPPVRSNPVEFGYLTSYQRGPERRYVCTAEQVGAGTCSAPIGDSFRFVPTAGVEVPRYWFMPWGTTSC